LSDLSPAPTMSVFYTLFVYSSATEKNSFLHWHRDYGYATLLELRFLCKISFDDLPLDDWEPEAL
jgi:hypothetical protein